MLRIAIAGALMALGAAFLPSGGAEAATAECQVYSAAPSWVAGTRQTLPCNTDGELIVSAGGGGGGTSSAYGDPFPADGTAIGFEDASGDMAPIVLEADGSLPVTVIGGDANTTLTPSASASAGIAPVVSASAETGHVIKASAGNLYGLQVTSGAAAGYVMVFNSTTVPAAGAVTPVKCFAIGANSSLGVSFDPIPLALDTGVSIAFSTTGCFTKTDSATAFISAQAM